MKIKKGLRENEKVKDKMKDKVGTLKSGPNSPKAYPVKLDFLS